MREHEGYRHLLDRQGCFFTGYETFCYEPTPWGLGYAPRDIERIIEERKTAQSHAQHAAPQRTIEEAMKGNKNAVKDKDVPSVIPFTLEGDIDEINSGVNNTTVFERGSTNASYLTARIARDRPDILDRMKAGDFPSGRAASMHRGRSHHASGPRDGRVGARRGVERVRSSLPRDL